MFTQVIINKIELTKVGTKKVKSSQMLEMAEKSNSIIELEKAAFSEKSKLMKIKPHHQQQRLVKTYARITAMCKFKTWTVNETEKERADTGVGRSTRCRNLSLLHSPEDMVLQYLFFFKVMINHSINGFERRSAIFLRLN